MDGYFCVVECHLIGNRYIARVFSVWETLERLSRTPNERRIIAFGFLTECNECADAYNED